LVIPTSSVAVLLLLLVAFVCLGSWANTFKMAGPRWRFELYSIDFGFGAFLVALIACFTLGMLGSELSFADRMLVAGRTKQAWAIIGGALFNLGNMLLIAAISLLGMGAAFPLTVGLALVIASLFSFRGPNLWFVGCGTLLMAATVVLSAVACRSRNKPTSSKTIGRNQTGQITKGILVSALAGLPWGIVYPIVSTATAGDFGLGAYAGILMISIGVVGSTVLFNVYFMKIAINGGPINLSAYFRGTRRQHILGITGGVIWAIGALAALLAVSAPSYIELNPALTFILPVASVLLASLWGLATWKENAGAPARARSSLTLAGVSLACGLVLLGFGFTR